MPKRSLVCIVIASSVFAASCAKSQKGGSHKPTANGSIKLEMRGSNCVITTKVPESTPNNPQKFQAGSTFTWDVTNTCSVDVTLGMTDKDKVNGNNLKVKDPFKGLTQSPLPIPSIPPNNTGTVSVTVKTKQELNPTSTNPGNRKWKFNWTVNCDKQNDPEIEIEGI